MSCPNTVKTFDADLHLVEGLAASASRYLPEYVLNSLIRLCKNRVMLFITTLTHQMNILIQRACMQRDLSSTYGVLTDGAVSTDNGCTVSHTPCSLSLLDCWTRARKRSVRRWRSQDFMHADAQWNRISHPHHLEKLLFRALSMQLMDEIDKRLSIFCSMYQISYSLSQWVFYIQSGGCVHPSAVPDRNSSDMCWFVYCVSKLWSFWLVLPRKSSESEEHRYIYPQKSSGEA